MIGFVEYLIRNQPTIKKTKVKYIELKLKGNESRRFENNQD